MVVSFGVRIVRVNTDYILGQKRHGSGDTKFHYEDTPLQIHLKFYYQKNENFQIKNSDIFHISAQHIEWGYPLEPPRRGGSNEYHNLCFSAEITKIVIPL